MRLSTRVIYNGQMMKFNDAALKEMGLYPLWQARGAASAEYTQPIDYIENNIIPVLRDNSARGQEIRQMDWQQLKQSIAACSECGLHKTRRHTVPGAGNVNAQWMFVGEGPGTEEDEQGEPFVGQAGKLLDNMLTSIELSRQKNVFITNVVKCHTADNRNPHADEVVCCAPYLQRQISLLQPKLIVALGKVAADHLLGHDATVASLRGKIHTAHNIPMIVTYHPAYLLRTPMDKAKAWEDLCFARFTMASLAAQTTASKG
jgi:uracil-DNA glycosylase